MSEEFNNFLKNNTWSLVPLLPGHTAIGCKWVSYLKTNADGTILRHKTRLVDKGYHQHPGIDFTDTFSLAVKPTTIRLVLSITLSSNFPLKHVFLHGHLNEEVYMPQLARFTHSDMLSHVYHLHRSL